MFLPTAFNRRPNRFLSKGSKTIKMTSKPKPSAQGLNSVPETVATTKLFGKRSVPLNEGNSRSFPGAKNENRSLPQSHKVQSQSAKNFIDVAKGFKRTGQKKPKEPHQPYGQKPNTRINPDDKVLFCNKRKVPVVENCPP